MSVNPDFKKLKAFVMSGVPDGSPVFMEDKHDNMPYIWRKGKVVLDTNDGAVSVTNELIDRELQSAKAKSSRQRNGHK